MKTSATIKENWKLCTSIGSFIGCIVLLSFLNSNQKGTNLTKLENAVMTETSSDQSFNHKQNRKNITMSQDRVISGTSADEFPLPNAKVSPPSSLTEDLKARDKAECDIFDGKWVYNPRSHPPYTGLQCPFVRDKFKCQQNGRPDSGYLNWIWEATGCQIPKFNGVDMLKRLRGKRLIFVGDSLNRNQYESLACLLYSALPPSRRNVGPRDAHNVFRVKDYDCSVESYWSPFLVEPEKRANGSRVLNLDRISISAKIWRGADIMVFNSGHWWMHGRGIKNWDVFQHNGKLVDRMEIGSAYEAALKTWAHWIDTNVDRKKTKVFFRSISPVHGGKFTCLSRTKPLSDDEESQVRTFPKSMVETVERIIGGMRTPVRYLNITKLSLYRVDAHPGFYLTKQGRSLMARRKQNQAPSNLKQTQLLPPDCNHWCLPGLPDTWNRLLYAAMYGMDNT